MRYMLKEMPKSERPRERLITYGASALADVELIALLLRTGTKGHSVMDVARDITLYFNQLSDTNEATIVELKTIVGIGEAKAIELLAAVELGKRIGMRRISRKKLISSQDSYHYLRSNMQHLTQETLVCIFLNAKNEIICDKVMTIGTLDCTIFHPRDILKWALKFSAYAIIVAHNHPSGDPMPSEMDRKMTEIIAEACKTIGLVFIDHLVIGHRRYYSFSILKEVKIIE